MSKRTKLTMGDVRDWINNDEGLYLWWRGSRMKMRAFILENKTELLAAIRSVLDAKPAR